jgi:prephenate dehydratase
MAMSRFRIAYLGPEGTFTEQALRTLPQAATSDLIPMASIRTALDAVRTGDADRAFVPIENSVEGGVTTTLDELAGDEPLMIFREVLLPISFAFLVRPGTRLDAVKTVTGHPVAQPQVRSWLARHVPTAVWESASSNADGARLVQEGRYDGAFAGVFAASLYDLIPLATGIHEVENAQTRFVLAGPPARPAARTGLDKTSVVVWLRDDRPGALLRLLQEFSAREVNIVRIESRPTGGGLGRYNFSIDCAGHIEEARVGEALMALKRTFPRVRCLGSYPYVGATAEPGQAAPRPDVSDQAFTAASDWLALCIDGPALPAARGGTGRFVEPTKIGSPDHGISRSPVEQARRTSGKG